MGQVLSLAKRNLLTQFKYAAFFPCCKGWAEVVLGADATWPLDAVLSGMKARVGPFILLQTQPGNEGSGSCT